MQVTYDGLFMDAHSMKPAQFQNQVNAQTSLTKGECEAQLWYLHGVVGVWLKRVILDKGELNFSITNAQMD